MIVKKIKYGRKFIKEFTKLPSEIKVLAIGKEDIFKKNPLHSSLRLQPRSYHHKDLLLLFRTLFLRSHQGSQCDHSLVSSETSELSVSHSLQR